MATKQPTTGPRRPHAASCVTTPHPDTVQRHGATVFSLAGIAAIVAADGTGAAVAVPGDDAEVLEACWEFFAADARVKRLDVTENTSDEQMNAAVCVWYETMERVTAVRATTAEGRVAKARVALLAMESLEDFATDREEQCALSALRDLVEGLPS